MRAVGVNQNNELKDDKMLSIARVWCKFLVDSLTTCSTLHITHGHLIHFISSHEKTKTINVSVHFSVISIFPDCGSQP